MWKKNICTVTAQLPTADINGAYDFLFAQMVMDKMRLCYYIKLLDELTNSNAFNELELSGRQLLVSI